MPNSIFWRDRSAALRERAATEEGERRQVLLVLAEDCEEIAAELEAGPIGRRRGRDHVRLQDQRRAAAPRRLAVSSTRTW